MGKTDFLFVSQGFLDGISRTLDIGGTYDCYNSSRNANVADNVATLNDWVCVGNDIKSAIKQNKL
jgi:hypothetical protein